MEKSPGFSKEIRCAAGTPLRLAGRRSVGLRRGPLGAIQARQGPVAFWHARLNCMQGCHFSWRHGQGRMAGVGGVFRFGLCNPSGGPTVWPVDAGLSESLRPGVPREARREELKTHLLHHGLLAIPLALGCIPAFAIPTRPWQRPCASAQHGQNARSGRTVRCWMEQLAERKQFNLLSHFSERQPLKTR